MKDFYLTIDQDNTTVMFTTMEDVLNALDSETFKVFHIMPDYHVASDVTEDTARELANRYDWELLNGEILDDRIPQIVQDLKDYQEIKEKAAREIESERDHERVLTVPSF